MSGEITATAEEQYWILRNTSGTCSVGSTPVGCVTSFSPAIWSVVWNGTDRDEWQRQCESRGIEAPLEPVA